MGDEPKPYTADQLEAGVHNALAAHNVEAAVDILKALIATDLDRGIKLYNDIQFALEFKRRLGR